jgi:LDH2 family malate/lactate/ureidoglycolate dehydrogenase
MATNPHEPQPQSDLCASWQRFDAAALQGFAEALLLRRGLRAEQAVATARILLEADLMGHSTHGLQLLAPYLREIEAGRMRIDGEPEVIADHGSAITWDGRFLPGPWLVTRAMATAFERIAAHPVVTIVVRRSHHIGCLAAYLPQATERGLMMLLSCSDPGVGSVAPHGAVAGRYTPNPIAAGFPTDGDPVLIDISMSTTTNGMTARMNRANDGRKLPGRWLVHPNGEATDDPRVMQMTPPGAILPLGGIEQGYKGFAMGLLVEALTSGLGGHGRADGESQWGASVFLQLIDPAAFGGRERFTRETGWLAQACRGAPVKPGNPPVRLPGERALASRATQRAQGVALHPEIMPALAAAAATLQVEPPTPL